MNLRRVTSRGIGSVAMAAVLGLALTSVGFAAGETKITTATAPAGANPMVNVVTGIDHSAKPAGSELRFVALAPCRLLDTREAGGALRASARSFTSTGGLGLQGGNPLGCGVSSNAIAVQLSLGAIAEPNSTGHVTAWQTGTTRPFASVLNYNPSGPIATMAMVQIDANGSFDLYTNSNAHLFADVVGYWVKPMYVAATSSGGFTSYSGIIATGKIGTGRYVVQFERNVRNCSASATDMWNGTRDVSVDLTYDFAPNFAYVFVTDQNGNFSDTNFYLSLTC